MAVQKDNALVPIGTEQCVDYAPASSSETGEIVPEEQRMNSTNQLVGDYYDVVVFSLLLSYLPCTVQRLTCCVHAHRVLQPHGLLLVVTPDSSHQNRHAALMKDWRHCVESVGFHRYMQECIWPVLWHVLLAAGGNMRSCLTCTAWHFVRPITPKETTLM